MASRQEKKDAWYDFVNDNTPKNVTVIFAEQVSGEMSPRPRKPFITLKFLNGPQPKNFDDLRYKGDQGLPTENKVAYTLAGLRQNTISIQAFGEGSEDSLALVQTLLDSPVHKDKLKAVGIAIVSRGQILDVSELIDVGFERRHVLDVVFNTSSNVDVVPGSIEKASISGKLKKADDTEIDTQFEVPAT